MKPDDADWFLDLPRVPFFCVNMLNPILPFIRSHCVLSLHNGVHPKHILEDLF